MLTALAPPATKRRMCGTLADSVSDEIYSQLVAGMALAGLIRILYTTLDWCFHSTSRPSTSLPWSVVSHETWVRIILTSKCHDPYHDPSLLGPLTNSHNDHGYFAYL